MSPVSALSVISVLLSPFQIGPMYRCARIQGLDSFEGIILFGKESYYILDGFTLFSTNEIQDIDSISEEYRDPIIPRTQHYTSGKAEKRSTKKTYASYDLLKLFLQPSIPTVSCSLRLQLSWIHFYPA